MFPTRFRSYGADPVRFLGSYKDLAPTEPVSAVRREGGQAFGRLQAAPVDG